MSFRRLLLLALALAMSLATLAGARADNEPFPGSRPVLREPSMWVETYWGYKLKTLDLTAGPFASEHPTLYETEGYGGAGKPNAYLRMPDGELMALNISCCRGPRGDYAFVKASVRGTECSGGSYNLYDGVHAWDGHFIVEWIAKQAWSNEAVGLHGGSLPGQTAYWITTTNPPHLKAVSANLLHSDIYRDIFMVGGVQNYLFPTIWTYGTGPHRIPRDRMQDQWFAGDEICQFNQTTKYSAGDPPQPQNEPAWAAIRSVDDDWYKDHAALNYAARIKIPYYQQSNWQDEQVGPRGLILWKHVSPPPVTVNCVEGGTKTFAEPKKMTVSSGDHGFGQFHNRDLYKFFDVFLLNKCSAAGVMDHRVESFFETRGDPTSSDYTARAYGDDWPLAGTRWPKTYLHEVHGMTASAPTGTESAETYISGAGRQNWFYDELPVSTSTTGQDVRTATGYPDQAWYLSPEVGEPNGVPTDGDGNFVINGPIMMNLWASLEGTDTDFFVSVSDVFPSDHPTNPGWVSYLQRGWLKASHRSVDPLRSYYADDPDTGGKTLVQPYMTHTNPQPITPNDPTEFQIEIFPLGHIFRPGHRILIQISTPPSVDGLWGYTPTHHQPGLVTILHDATHRTWIQWPWITLPADQPAPTSVDGDPGSLGVNNPPSGCKIPGGFPCSPPSALDIDLLEAQ